MFSNFQFCFHERNYLFLSSRHTHWRTRWRDCRLPGARSSQACLCGSDTGWARVATSAGSTDTKLKWTYTVQEYVFRFVNKRILNSCIITLSRPYSVLLNECKIFHCRIGAMMEERPETGHTYRCTLWSNPYFGAVHTVDSSIQNSSSC